MEVAVGLAGNVPGMDDELAATQRGLAVLAVDRCGHSASRSHRVPTVLVHVRQLPGTSLPRRRLQASPTVLHLVRESACVHAGFSPFMEQPVMLVLGLGLEGCGLGLETKSLALVLCAQFLVLLKIVQV